MTKRDGKIMGIVAAIIVGFAAVLYPMIPITVPCKVAETYRADYHYEVINGSFAEMWSPSLGDYAQSEFAIRNKEEFGGTFQVIHELHDINGLFRNLTDSFHLDGGQNHTSTVIFITSKWQDARFNTIRINPPDYTNWTLVTEQRTFYVSIVKLLMHVRFRLIYPIIKYQGLKSFP